jgi:deazaflavin-dependent oxidoreductase (nitroreductase family)
MARQLDITGLPWPVRRGLFGAHKFAYRTTRGLIGHRVPGVGAPTLLLDHVGAKSARRRTTPLIYIPDGERLAIIASKGGHPRHPAWFHNLRANPSTTVQIGSKRRAVMARVANGEERERLWRRAVELWPLYADYQARTNREIPVVVLDPR